MIPKVLLFSQMMPSNGLSLRPEVPSTGLASWGRQGRPQERPRVSSCCVCYLSLSAFGLQGLLRASRSHLPRNHAVLLQSGLFHTSFCLTRIRQPSCTGWRQRVPPGGVPVSCHGWGVPATPARALVRRRAPPECHRLADFRERVLPQLLRTK